MLDVFARPRSVAVIGASREPDKLGYSVLHNIVQHGYQGPIYPVNPKAGEILGLRCYPSVLVTPGEPDLAVIVIPSRHVVQALVECGERGTRGAVVLSAGFRETGQEGWQREREMVDVARHYGMRILGPNCLGLIDSVARLNASFAVGMPRVGSIAFVSQSGALCTAVLDMALAEQVGFSRFVSLGNRADLDEVDFIRAWADDPHTRVIMAYFEGVEHGVDFMRVAAEVSYTKPIIAVKSGTTGAGSRAVSSHTGTLAGSERAYEAAFRQSGVIRARSVQELFDFSILFARQPLLENDRIAIVTNAGGPGVMATDACERAGLQLASLEPETMAALRQGLPVAASVLNPVDILGDARADRYALALRQVMDDPNVGGVIVILSPQIMTQVVDTAELIGQMARGAGKPILGCFMGREIVGPGVEVLNRYAVPNYPIPERAVSALAAMMAHRRWRERPPVQIERFAIDHERVRGALQRVRDEGRLTMGEAEAQEILAACNIPTPHTRLAHNADEAVGLAQEIGFPVAIKIASPDILHKTDVGGVRLNVSSPDEVRVTFERVLYDARRRVPDADIWGCLVQEMIVGGREVIVGMHRDPHFGPLVMFGLGGIYVEALRDVTFRVAPFDRRQARDMVGEIRAHNLLRGIRGEHPSDLNALVDTLLRLSQLVIDVPEIVEFDVNPLTVFDEGRGLVGIDMRLVFR